MSNPNNPNDVRDTDKPGTGTATGVGAVLGGAAGGVAGGAAAGAMIGGMTGPVGALVGAAVGVVAGALAGKSVAADPVAEDAYWKDNYASRSYVESGSTYDDYGPAYGYGVSGFNSNPDRKFEDVEPEMSRDWGKSRGNSGLEWDRAKHASRDAWNRLSDKVERAVPGDSDRDGK
jgi:hypothetical protein